MCIEFLQKFTIYTIQELPAAPSLNLIQGQCELATDYVKKKNTLRLRYQC